MSCGLTAGSGSVCLDRSRGPTLEACAISTATAAKSVGGTGGSGRSKRKWVRSEVAGQAARRYRGAQEIVAASTSSIINQFPGNCPRKELSGPLALRGRHAAEWR